MGIVIDEKYHYPSLTEKDFYLTTDDYGHILLALSMNYIKDNDLGQKDEIRIGKLALHRITKKRGV